MVTDKKIIELVALVIVIVLNYYSHQYAMGVLESQYKI